MGSLSLPSDACGTGWKQKLLQSEMAVLEFTAFAEGLRSSCSSEVGFVFFFAVADEQGHRGFGVNRSGRAHSFLP